MSTHLPPLFFELPYLADSSHYFECIRDLSWAVYLDSTRQKNQQGRYDILAAEPIVTITSNDGKTVITDMSCEPIYSHEDPFTVLEQQLQRYPQQIKTDLPFCGGAIGYFSYDLNRQLEHIPTLAENNEAIPDMAVGIYDWALTVDHEKKQCWLASFGNTEHTHQQWQALINRFSTFKPQPPHDFVVSGELRCNLNQDAYTRAFDKIQHYIKEGDCYQVNLAKRFEIEASGDPWHAYRTLRQQNAAPFSAYFSIPEVTLLSSSPERLLMVKNQQVETKPIKGTRRRHINNREQDQAAANELLTSTKDRAENLMIVDLLRNDLGKVCVPGSISVPSPFALESFATVHHLVSTITGTLDSDHSPVSLLRACFPGGSITGAPKLRAMEIIEELEPHRRGAYCGSIAYIGFDGAMDSNILIRTLVFNNNKLRFWAGGGIVFDSTAAAEYQEAHDKAAAMIALIEQLR